MKKIRLATASVFALASIAPIATAQADSNFKSGFKVGGGVGYKHHRVKSQSSYTADPGVLGLGADPIRHEGFSKSESDNTAALQLHAGYDLVINRFLAAIEFDYRYSPSEVKMRFNTTQGFFVPAEAPFEVQQQHAHDFGFSARLGALVIENLALYAIGNVRLGKFKHKFLNKKPSAQALPSHSKSKYLWGVGGGVGARYAFPKGVSLAFETTYDVYQKIKINEVSLNEDAGTFNTQSKAPHVFIAMLKLSKTF